LEYKVLKTLHPVGIWTGNPLFFRYVDALHFLHFPFRATFSLALDLTQAWGVGVIKYNSMILNLLCPLFNCQCLERLCCFLPWLTIMPREQTDLSIWTVSLICFSYYSNHSLRMRKEMSVIQTLDWWSGVSLKGLTFPRNLGQCGNLGSPKKKMPVILVNRTEDTKIIIRKNGGPRRKWGTRGCWLFWEAHISKNV
jgi:hypothetical protein